MADKLTRLLLPKINKIHTSSVLARPKGQLPSSLNVFDRETKRAQRNRIVTQPDYKQYEYVKEEIGYRVADRIFDIKRSFNTMLDLGCQRGYVSKHLTKVDQFLHYNYNINLLYCATRRLLKRSTCLKWRTSCWSMLTCPKKG